MQGEKSYTFHRHFNCIINCNLHMAQSAFETVSTFKCCTVVRCCWAKWYSFIVPIKNAFAFAVITRVRTRSSNRSGRKKLVYSALSSLWTWLKARLASYQNEARENLCFYCCNLSSLRRRRGKIQLLSPAPNAFILIRLGILTSRDGENATATLSILSLTKFTRSFF